MFDIGFSELLVVSVVGLLILGPERLPHAAKTAGLWVRKIRRSINSVQREINAQLDQEELQQKISETNQRILKEGEAIQNTITPLAESASRAENQVDLEPIHPAQQDPKQDHLQTDDGTIKQAEANTVETPPAASEEKKPDVNLSRS